MKATYGPRSALVPTVPLAFKSDFLDPRAWDSLVATDHLVPLTEDIARAASAEATARLRAIALATMCPPRAVIGTFSATWVYLPRTGAKLSGLMPKVVTVPHRREMHRGRVTCLYQRGTAAPARSRLGACTLRQTRLWKRDVRVVEDPALELEIRITTPERTLLDIVCAQGPSTMALLAAIRAFSELGVDPGAVRARLEALNNWRGRVQGLRVLHHYLTLNRL
ncbi:hypothetical protein [Rarobacter incanus]|uniref:AbiEi antitoxin C-terminal domain-containing protein n=1 Tax=Rarobacter incanus TaxID=153494 RepID=A0A542SMU8_9MICO|nr:hypothetical protein [Rarobacter incanus]TQK75898.1 hypothetical protein FB389_0540 [Rarobacter incanus]